MQPVLVNLQDGERLPLVYVGDGDRSKASHVAVTDDALTDRAAHTGDDQQNHEHGERHARRDCNSRATFRA